ncbi:Uncharacterised protein [Streptococcus pneumoniae]|nr:Uncharacterised protein [Streptococcus pneumoniae]CRH97292.1 Uncharacterised protein [Streptococcus pneumoniae]
MLPLGWKISIPAPTAATFGSSSKNTVLPPERSAASRIAFCSTDVIFVGQQIKIRGFEKKLFTSNLLMKYFNIASVISKSAITPSLSGRIATILPGVRPTMLLASSPTANTLPLLRSIATTDGSFNTIPLPLT